MSLNWVDKTSHTRDKQITHISENKDHMTINKNNQSIKKGMPIKRNHRKIMLQGLTRRINRILQKWMMRTRKNPMFLKSVDKISQAREKQTTNMGNQSLTINKNHQSIKIGTEGNQMKRLISFKN